MDNKEDSKQNLRRASDNFPRGDEPNLDLTLALNIREPEQDLPLSEVLSTIESVGESAENEIDDSEGEDDDESMDDSRYEYFDTFGFEDELLEEQGSNSFVDEDDDYVEDDDIDPDELSYEELVALGDIIGVEKRGLSESEIYSCLHAGKFRCELNTIGIERCVICQVEYEEGELLVALPCQHPYHLECVSQWLQIKRVCPICNTEASSALSKSDKHV